ncbi:hypothetical protein TNCV_377421 [Trichonephila clavipes]|nr:hypothetical protein TNCV_377421 [Trichonephila clavipes]
MPVIRRIGERTIPYSWRACEQLRHLLGSSLLWVASFVHSPTVSSKKLVSVNNDNVCADSIMADIDILKLIKSRKNIIEAYSERKVMNNATPVLTSSKMKNTKKTVDKRRYPRAENRVWSDQENHEERGSKDLRQALVDPTVTRSTIRADVGLAIVPQTISRHLAEANLKSKRPFRALL